MSVRGLSLVACAPGLPAEAQLRLAEAHLAGHLTATVAAGLASRPDLDATAAGVLCGSGDPAVRLRALRSVDAATLGSVAGSGRVGVRTLAAAATNRSAPPDLLARLASHPDRGVALRAVCNPSTPEAARRATLSDPGTAGRLVAARSPLGAEVVRAGEVALVNPWLVEHAGRLPASLLRGLSGLPSCPLPVLERYASRWRSAGRHPARQGLDVTRMSAADLVGNGTPAAHLELLSRPDSDATTGAAILAGTPASGSSPAFDPEPHLIGRVFRRFGSAPLLHGVPARMAGTRIATAAWAEPFAGEMLRGCSSPWTASASFASELAVAAAAAERLGGDAPVWEVFVSVASGCDRGDERLRDAAEVSLVVAG